MITMNNITGKFFFPVIFLISFAFYSCSDNNVPTTPNYPPNTFCDITGDYNMAYKGQGTVFGLNNPFGIMVNTFYKDSTGKIYYLGINVYFKDGNYNTGTFSFVGKTDPNLNDYAVGYFETGVGANKQTFITYSGEVKIDEITLTKFKGTFNFLAKDTGGNSIMVKNGTVEIID